MRKFSRWFAIVILTISAIYTIWFLMKIGDCNDGWFSGNNVAECISQMIWFGLYTQNVGIIYYFFPLAAAVILLFISLILLLVTRRKIS